jgi:hypothetical protein
MKTWLRAKAERRCDGPCGRRILKGDPVLELTLPGLHRRPWRCAACAGEPVPPELLNARQLQTAG